MKVECKKLDHLFEKHPDDIQCRLYSPVIAAGKKYKPGFELTHRDIGVLIRAGVTDIDLFFDVTLYEYLSHEFPFEFRRPLRWLDYYTLDQHLEDLDHANAQSQRKRFLSRSPAREELFRHSRQARSPESPVPPGESSPLWRRRFLCLWQSHPLS